MSASVEEKDSLPVPSVENLDSKPDSIRPVKLSRPLAITIVAAIVIIAVASVTMFVTYAMVKGSIDHGKCQVKVCGQTGPDFSGTRIVGGRDATKDEFPYQVIFTDMKGVVFCGGSMINDRWILTAAHCFFTSSSERTVDSVNVSVGVRFASEIKQNMIQVERIWLHPNYEFSVLSRMFDIALVKTKASINESSSNFVNPICLPYSDMETTNVSVGTVSGFGATVEGGPVNNRLKTASIRFQDDIMCGNIYTGYLTYDSNSMICAGNLKGGEDTCQGDSGGPLAIRNENGSYVLRGITSHGRGCGRANSLGVYTKVSHYLDWVCDKMIDQGIN